MGFRLSLRNGTYQRSSRISDLFRESCGKLSGSSKSSIEAKETESPSYYEMCIQDEPHAKT